MLKKNLAASLVFAACVSLVGIAQAAFHEALVFYVPIGGNEAVDIAGVMDPDPTAGGVINAFFSNDTPGQLPAGGQSLDFNSPDQVVDFGNLPLLEGAEASTVSMWVKAFEVVPDGNRRHYTLSKDGILEYGLRNGEITNRINNADHAQSTGLVLEEVWTHLASVFDANGDGGGGTTQHYVNGVPFGDAILLDGNEDPGDDEGGLVYRANDNSLTLANRSEGDNKDFNGLIDDIAIWNFALPASSIDLLFTGTDPREIPVPEPSTLVLVALGFIGLLGARRRRKA